VGGKLIKALRFADDQAMLASREKDVGYELKRTTKDYRMKINTKKTKRIKSIEFSLIDGNNAFRIQKAENLQKKIRLTFVMLTSIFHEFIQLHIAYTLWGHAR